MLARPPLREDRCFARRVTLLVLAGHVATPVGPLWGRLAHILLCAGVSATVASGGQKSSDEGCTAYSGLQCPVRDVRACRGPIDEQHVRTKSACTHTSTWQERLALRRMWWKSVSRAGRVSDAVYGRPDRRPANGGPAASEGDCRRTAGSLATLVRRAVWRPTGLPATVAAIHPQAVLPQHQATSDVRGDVPRTRPA